LTCDPTAKNRVWDFFDDPAKPRPSNRPRLKETLEKEIKTNTGADEPEGFTKEVSLSNGEIEKLIKEIEAATGGSEMISLQEAINIGLKVSGKTK